MTGKRKTAARIFASVSILFAVSGCRCGQYYSFVPALRPDSPSQPGVVKVMTYNIRVDTIADGFNAWRTRKDRVTETIRENSADVVGVQEALDYQVWGIQQALPQYRNYAAGRNDGKRDGETCAIFYREDRYTLLDKGTFWFSDTPSVPGSRDWGDMWPRICSWVRLAEKDSGMAFYVYNVHMAAFSDNAREKSVQLLAKKVAARKTDDPFIVMGDFNMELDEPGMLYLQQIGVTTPYPKMVDAWVSLNPRQKKPDTTKGLFGMFGGSQFDHIPICETARALEVKIGRRKVAGRYPSDHFPVIAKILLEPNVAPPLSYGG